MKDRSVIILDSGSNDYLRYFGRAEARDSQAIKAQPAASIAADEATPGPAASLEADEATPSPAASLEAVEGTPSPAASLEAAEASSGSVATRDTRQTAADITARAATDGAEVTEN